MKWSYEPMQISYVLEYQLIDSNASLTVAAATDYNTLSDHEFPVFILSKCAGN